MRKRIVKNNNHPICINVKNKNYLNFSSNDYLGLSQNSRIINAWKKGIDIYGIGSCSSYYISGYSRPHKELEEKISDWLSFSSSLLCISGFSANQAIINTLILKKEDKIFADKLIHASLIEACYNSRGIFRRFFHNDFNHLKKILSKSKKNEGINLIITEGVFSMDGDIAPLEKIYAISKKNKSLLLVDDSHGIGILGKEGRGICYSKKIKPDILMFSFSKAFGSSGAIICCSHDLYNYFLQFSKFLIYSSPMPPAQAYAISRTLQIIKSSDDIRSKLYENILYFCKKAKYIPGFISNSISPIQIIIIGNNRMAMEYSKKLKKAKCWVPAIRTPTVPKNTARLRINLNAQHTLEDIDYLLENLYEIHEILSKKSHFKFF